MTPGKIGRNDPCPCGSGKKFKNCCLGRDAREPAEVRTRAESVAIDWLRTRHSHAAETALRQAFFASLDDVEIDRLEILDSQEDMELQDLMRDWLVAEAVLQVKGHDVRSTALVLGPGGPSLQPREREWLNALMATPMGLYEVVEPRIEKDVLLVRDLLAPGAPAIRVATPDPEEVFDRWELLGARLVLFEGAHRFGAPPLSFLRQEAPRLRALAAEDRSQLSAELIDFFLEDLLVGLENEVFEDDLDPEDDDENWVLRDEVLPEWEDPVTPSPVADLYRVADWPKLTVALAEEPGVEGDLEIGWFRYITDLEGEIVTSVSMSFEQGCLRAFTDRETADETETWLGRIVGSSISRLAPINSDAVDVGADEPPPIPELAEIQADREAYFRVWIDAPLERLKGRTPRALLADPTARTELLDLIKESECDEQHFARIEDRLPADLGFLWRELGLDPAAA